MPSNRSGFTASARWSKPTDFSEHTSLPTEFARFLTVLTTNISLLHRRSPDRALGKRLPVGLVHLLVGVGGGGGQDEVAIGAVGVHRRKPEAEAAAELARL